MASQEKEIVKILIELATDVEQVDKIINVYYGSKTTREKVELLKNMFDTTIAEHCEPDEDIYQKILCQVTKAKRN